MSVGPSSPNEFDDKLFGQTRNTAKENECGPHGALDETETARPAATRFPTHVAIEGYEIIRELHRGGQGVVYEALQKSTRRKVAIKLLLEGRFASASARRRFQREVTLAAALKHPNIIAIFDSGETSDGHQFCVMDYVRGASIRNYIRENKLPLEATLELFSSVCEAAHFAHQKGVIHRDLKPSNIIVDTDGVPRLLDFGLAKQLAGGEASLVSMTGQVMGTLQYMSPEQTRGNPDEIDARSDVYSLGVILYELLTGQHPYPVKGEMVEVLKHITETEPTPPSKVWDPKSGVSRRKSRRFRPGQCPIDNELQTILLKALSKERNRRYQTAEALRVDIERYLHGEPIEAKRDSSLYVLKKSLRRHGTQIAVIVGFVAVSAVALSLSLKARTRQSSTLAPIGPITSLAVLPLENLSGDPEQEYFADGMTVELITALAKIRGLKKVISQTSAMSYKGTRTPSAQIARDLGVEALVDGTVMRSGNRVRIAVNLISGDTSEQFWSNSYERNMRDVLAMQYSIARDIAGEIQIKLTPQEQLHLASARPVNPEAYEHYLKGQYHYYKWRKEEFEKAIEYFQKAIEADPNYADAYVGLANSYGWLWIQGYLSLKEGYPRYNAALTRALEIDEALPEAHYALAAAAFYYRWNWADAEKEFRRALALNPSLSEARLEYAWYLSAMGRFAEALAEAERTLQLDPLSVPANLALGSIYHNARQDDQAIAQLLKTVELEPNDPRAYGFLAGIYEKKGMYEEAVRVKQKAMTLSGAPAEEVAALGRAYSVSGPKGYLMWLLERSKAPYFTARIYALLGDKDQAFVWLEKAYQEHYWGMVGLKSQRSWDPLRDDPRFDDLLRRMRLNPESKSQAAEPLGV